MKTQDSMNRSVSKNRSASKLSLTISLTVISITSTGCATFFKGSVTRGQAAEDLKTVAVVGVYTNRVIRDAETNTALLTHPAKLAERIRKAEVLQFVRVPRWKVIPPAQVTSDPYFQDFKRRQETRLSKREKKRIRAIGNYARTPLRRRDVLLHRNIKHLRWLANNMKVDGVAVVEVHLKLKKIGPDAYRPIVASSLKIVDREGRLAVASEDPKQSQHEFASSQVLRRRDLKSRNLTVAFEEAIRESALDLADRIRDELPHERAPKEVAKGSREPKFEVSQVGR